jgi:hypothetical protein
MGNRAADTARSGTLEIIHHIILGVSSWRRSKEDCAWRSHDCIDRTHDAQWVAAKAVAECDHASGKRKNLLVCDVR